MLSMFWSSFQKIAFYQASLICNSDKQKIRITLISLVIALFFSFPSYDVLSSKDYIETHWKPVLLKVLNPLFDLNTLYGPGSHASKNNLRLTVPIIAYLFHLNIWGILLFVGFVGICLFYVINEISLKITKDPVASLFSTLTVSSIYAGITSFVELRGNFDGVAIFFLITSLLPNPLLIWVSLSLAFWTDERAVIAGALVLLFHCIIHNDVCKLCIFNINSLSVIIAYLLYILLRVFLAFRFNLYTTISGFGLQILMDQVNNIPMGIWTGLEGGWIIVISAVLLLLLQRSFLSLSLFVAFMVCVIGVAVSVVDITRSMTYILPAFFIALKILTATETREEIRRLLLIAWLVSLLWPNYYAGGKHSIWWHYPLPIQVVRWVLGR